MLIFNQKRDIIINFSNVLSIYVQEKNVQVLISQIEDALILGKYKTEERAKKVLQEITREYINSNSSFGSRGYVKNEVFYMPEDKEDKQ